MSRRRAVWVGAGLIGFGPALVLGALSMGGEQGVPELLVAVTVLGTRLALAAGVVLRRLGSAPGRDVAERLLVWSTESISGPRAEWAAAMRAELASITSSAERRRFALGCARTALRVAADRMSWTIAIGVAVVLAAGTLIVSRVSLAAGREGILGFTLLAPVVTIFVASASGASGRRGSFQTGLIRGGLALLVSIVAVLATATVEASWWYHVAGVYVMDGDIPKAVDGVGVALDPLRPSFVFFHLLFWMAWPVLGAAAGAWWRLVTRGAVPPATTIVR